MRLATTVPGAVIPREGTANVPSPEISNVPTPLVTVIVALLNSEAGTPFAGEALILTVAVAPSRVPVNVPGDP